MSRFVLGRDPSVRRVGRRISRDRYVSVLEASAYRQFRGTSVVLDLAVHLFEISEAK
jgi:hypothetical protein